MKKIYSIVAALCFCGAANAVTWDAASLSENPAAETVLTTNALADVKTVYATKLNSGNKWTFDDGSSFTKDINLRVEAAPSAGNLTGTQRTDCTPLVITANDDIRFTIYYRRQKGSEGTFKSNDNKDIKMVDQAAITTLLEPSYYSCSTATTESYGFAMKTFTLTAGSVYTLFATGTTGRLAAYNIEETQIVSIGSTGFATFVAENNCVIPAGVTAYTIALNENGKTISATALAADAVIPQGTALLLKGAVDTSYEFAQSDAEATTISNNDLKGNATAITDAGANDYVLIAQDGGSVAFQKATTGSHIPGGKAYLTVTNELTLSSNIIPVSFGEATAIEAVESEEAPEGFFDLEGNSVANPQKGMYIYKGRIVVVK